MYLYGNPQVEKKVLPDNSVQTPFVPSGGPCTGMILHSRGAQNFRVSFKLGGVDESVTGETYFTVTAGNYTMFESQEQIDKIYLRSDNVGGDTIEIITFDTRKSQTGGYTP